VFWRERAECDEVKAYYQIRYGSDHNQLTQMIANQDYYEHYIDELLLLTGIRKARAFFVDYGASSPIFSLAATRRGVYRSLAVDWDENARAYGAERGLTCFAPDEFERRTAAAARESKE
jgi:ribosomal protein L11 methylase PrmA